MTMDVRRTWLLLVAIAAVLSASGLVLQYGFGVIPCQMCWWQRYAHYVVLGLALVGMMVQARSDKAAKGVLAAIVLAALGGLGIAVWQYCAQHGWLPFPASCKSEPGVVFAAGDDLLAAMQTTKIIPCDKETFTLLGLSLAGWNIPAMLFVIGTAVLGFRRPLAR